MAVPKKLKVFRTPIGFHDAFVAATSQKVALEAWGSDSNLFAQGVAELVTDPQLTKEPLANPGQVIRKLRGSEEEQIKALGSSIPKKGRRAASSSASVAAKRRGPRPSLAAVEKAEKALEGAEARHREALGKIKAKEEALDRKRRNLECKQRDERARLTRDVNKARGRYRLAMAEWAGIATVS